MGGTEFLKEELEKLEHPELLIVGARTFSTSQAKVIPATVELQYSTKAELILALLEYTEGDSFSRQMLFVQIVISKVTEEHLVQLLELDYFTDFCEDNAIPYEENTENSLKKKRLAVDLALDKKKFDSMKESFIDFEIQYATDEEITDEDLEIFGIWMTFTVIHFLLNESGYEQLGVLQVLKFKEV